MLFYKYISLKDFIQKNFTLQGISKEISLFTLLSLVAYTFFLIRINPEDYRYELTEDDMLVLTITSKGVIPDDFPVPCNCFKCAKKTFVPVV